MPGSGCVFGASSGDARANEAAAGDRTINAGRMLSLQRWAVQHEAAQALARQSFDRSTADWRAVCGRSASTVRRGGEPKPIGSPYPYRGLREILAASRARVWKWLGISTKLNNSQPNRLTA